MKEKSSKREKKKKKGEFSKKNAHNKARRQYLIAGMLGGKEWADKCVAEGKIKKEDL